jgi:hypothetical protein
LRRERPADLPVIASRQCAFDTPRTATLSKQQSAAWRDFDGQLRLPVFFVARMASARVLQRRFTRRQHAFSRAAYASTQGAIVPIDARTQSSITRGSHARSFRSSTDD